MKKIVLAFSGGLDTSFCIPWLRAERDAEVHTVMVNTGGFSAAEALKIEQRALKLGAASHTTIDAVETYYNKGVRFLLFGNVLKNDTYPLSVSSERVFQAMEVLKHVKKLGASAVAHGCTGAGNDQIRFDLVFEVMAPEVEIIAPIRELALSRQQEIDYLVGKGFDWDWSKSKYSINQGLWGTSVGGVETLSSAGVLPEAAYPSQITASEPLTLTIGFVEGEPCSLDGVAMKPIELIRRLNELGGSYGVGRDIHVGDTIIGLKGRVGFEAAGPLMLIKAHHLLEKHTLTAQQLFLKDILGRWYGQQMHGGLYLDPAMRDAEAFLSNSQQRVTGTVQVVLRPWHFFVTGCSTPNDLMSGRFGDYGEMNRTLTPADMVGFTKVLATPLKIYYEKD